MKIALVHPRLDHRGGAENVVCWMARALIGRGHDVMVATDRFEHEQWEAHHWQGIAIAVLRPGPLDRLKLGAARKRALGGSLRRALGACDVIVAHNSPAQVWATVAARRMPGTRVIWYCEEPKMRFYWSDSMPRWSEALANPDRHPWLRSTSAAFTARRAAEERSERLRVDREVDREAAARVDRTLANSAFTAECVARVYGSAAAPCLLGMPEPPAVDVAASDPYVAWITSPVGHKNAYGFLEAIHRAVHSEGASDLLVRAVGLQGDEFARRIAELSLDGVVRRESWLSDDELNRLLAGCRLLAYPPIEEPFGLVPLHAMAHGRPVLASNLGGPSETVVDGVTGMWIDPLDPADMAKRLVELWRSPTRCDSLGAAGRERYRSHFTFEHFMDRFEALALHR